MSEIWIQEEQLNAEFDEMVGHYVQLEGPIDSVYFISETMESVDDRDEQRDFLLAFLIKQDRYPLYLTFLCDDMMAEEFEKEFNQLGIEYSYELLEEKQAYYTFFKRVTYHPRCFNLPIKDARTLSLALEHTFYLANMNQFYSLSYSKNLSFELKRVKEWGRWKNVSIPIFKTAEDTTFITIFHDGAGFFLFSNESRYSSIQKVCLTFPEGSRVVQINDQLIDQDEEA
ncbi:hypothetical protein P2R64_29405 [Priestia megaterium]|uniref:hypothetical protein n=1 Tax=Priestia megaterium TaxID=1404 RepID=UPI0021C1D2F3|nr:hypothetical protein [Priestia megaterium]MCT9852139.1 hypothetical protein [Priestia megaterium]MDF1964176.1 hypothetical protein [Priestia megaterium]